MSHLLLPNGLRRKPVIPISREDMAWLAMGEEMLHKLGLTLCCVNCLKAGLKQGAVLRGENDVTDQVMSVTCDCRRLTYQAREDDSHAPAEA